MGEEELLKLLVQIVSLALKLQSRTAALVEDSFLKWPFNAGKEFI